LWVAGVENPYDDRCARKSIAPIQAEVPSATLAPQSQKSLRKFGRIQEKTLPCKDTQRNGSKIDPPLPSISVILSLPHLDERLHCGNNLGSKCASRKVTESVQNFASGVTVKVLILQQSGNALERERLENIATNKATDRSRGCSTSVCRLFGASRVPEAIQYRAVPLPHECRSGIRERIEEADEHPTLPDEVKAEQAVKGRLGRRRVGNGDGRCMACDAFGIVVRDGAKVASNQPTNPLW
jgi:hypothetical protein